MEWEVGYSQNTGLFGALRLKDLPIIQINPYGVFFDFFWGASVRRSQYGPFDKLSDRTISIRRFTDSPISQ